MNYLDWLLVLFGAAVAVCGGRLQLRPERIFPGKKRAELGQRALGQLRLLGGSFLFMGVFFSLQMAVDLIRLPWWTGTLSGLAVAIAAVHQVTVRSLRQGQTITEALPGD
jgi:hypothetical protein